MRWAASPASNQSPIHRDVQEPSLLWCGSWAVSPGNPGQSVPPGLSSLWQMSTLCPAADPKILSGPEAPGGPFWILHRLLRTFMEILRVTPKPPSRPWLFPCSLEIPSASVFVWLADNLWSENKTKQNKTQKPSHQILTWAAAQSCVWEESVPFLQILQCVSCAIEGVCSNFLDLIFLFSKGEVLWEQGLVRSTSNPKVKIGTAASGREWRKLSV